MATGPRVSSSQFISIQPTGEEDADDLSAKAAEVAKALQQVCLRLVDAFFSMFFFSILWPLPKKLFIP